VLQFMKCLAERGLTDAESRGPFEFYNSFPAAQLARNDGLADGLCGSLGCGLNRELPRTCLARITSHGETLPECDRILFYRRSTRCTIW